MARLIIILISCLLLNKSLFSQNGKLVVVKDQDTLDVTQINVSIFIEINNRLVPFNFKEQLICSDIALLDSVNSIVVLYKGDSIRFFNLEMKLKQSSLPESLTRALQPHYKDLFSTNQNMLFNIDTFPFENSDHMMIAEDEASKDKMDISKYIVLTLYYQLAETMAIMSK